MFEFIIIPLLIGVGLAAAFAVGRIWNEKPLQKKVVRLSGDTSQEAMIKEFAIELKKRSRALRHYSKKIDKTNPSNGQIEKLEKMSSRVDGMLNLLVAYSKLDDFEMEERTLSLESPAKRALEEMRRKGEPFPKLVFSPMQDCIGDPELLKQFFLVLFRNCTSKEGRTTVQIGGLDGDRKGLAKFHVTFKFPSHGVDPANPFILYNNQRNLSNRKGRGLAFCKRIIALHGGNVWCQAGHDGSITFWCSLPVAVNASI